MSTRRRHVGYVLLELAAQTSIPRWSGGLPIG
jgi:hypothetical protein